MIPYGSFSLKVFNGTARAPRGCTDFAGESPVVQGEATPGT